MELQEHISKDLLAKYGISVPRGRVASTPDEAVTIANELGGFAWMVKAQIQAGGRGKAGGVRYVTSVEHVHEVTKSLLGKPLITYQTGPRGLPVNQVLITSPCDIARELYLGLVIDRSTRKIVVMVSPEGGVEIEKVASETPDKIFKAALDLETARVQPDEAIALGHNLELTPDQITAFVRILDGLGRLFIELDLSLLEINPLIVDKKGQLVCLDAKIAIDENALFRQSDLKALRDASQEDPRESHARAFELNYISLEGNIGCMVNGAGLAMATMDLIKLEGGSPANFLDVGGGATKERVAEAFKIILSDGNVKGILVNIFGGIVRCDMVAEGIIEAVKEVGVQVPVVVRLEGNRADLGIEKLKKSGLNLIAATGLTQAAQKIVAAVQAGN